MSVVCITGAAGEMGKTFAYECAKRGFDLFLTSRNGVALEEIADAIRREYGVEVMTHPCDLMSIDDIHSLKSAIESSCSQLNMLINVAGMGHECLFESLDEEKLLEIINLNVRGTVLLTHLLLPLKCRQEIFRIINVSSLAAFQPMPYKSVYASSKRFLLDWSYALCEELKGAATVTALCPAGLATNPRVAASIAAQGKLGVLTTKSVDFVIKKTLDAALKGKKLVIPGFINRLSAVISSILPRTLSSKFVYNRWNKIYDKSECDADKSQNKGNFSK